MKRSHYMQQAGNLTTEWHILKFERHSLIQLYQAAEIGFRKRAPLCEILLPLYQNSPEV